MADGNHSQTIPNCPIPVSQIDATRAGFPGTAVTFEIEFLVTDPWSGLAVIARAMAACGLALEALRCSGDGAILCRVADTPGCDLARLAQVLDGAEDVRIFRWTTVLGF
ncbi:hypothetical protein [Defluviimonas sp. WL0075]|uniref:ACT domain-containing protein n=1 Tax=Albidovulum sediminicola TaxID=2984331 RepID=A0ABT2Z2C6_9RHOB|nr:hypothetical protein [Defluviimonas sp. WL0075]MCV2865180.1 hypothetical protein [Defluviimonas sp. WL0075]